MHTTCLRKVGGSVMLAVPPALLDVLSLAPGARVGLTVDNGRLVVHAGARPRYALGDLLTEAETSGTYPLPEQQREWIDAPATGTELA